MNKRLFLKFAAGASLVLATCGVSFAADTLTAVKAAGVLRVATGTAFAPFDYMDNGKHVGLNGDVFKEIGKELGVKIEWVLLPWQAQLPGLEAGKFDMIAGPAGITKARMERYRFSPPIAEGTDSLLKRAGDKSIMKPEDIAGKTVGSQIASSQLSQLQAFVKTLDKKVVIREYPGANESNADLAAGRVVAVANGLPNNMYAVKKRPDLFAVVLPPFGPKTYFGYIGLKDSDHASLMDAVDKIILKMKADGRLGELQKKWIGAAENLPDTVTDPSI